MPANGGTDELLIRRVRNVGSVTLNRARLLNAMNHEMFLGLKRALEGWAHDPAVLAVVIRGSARPDGSVPFCAGGDLKSLYDGRLDPERRLAHRLYDDEYRLNALIFRYRKPYVALIDGFVMGAGVGVSVYGSHRVMSERALFAMPETGIGLFPDIGATYFLPRCPGRFGLYLGLTGARIGVADALHLGLASHFVPAERFAALDQALLELDLSRDARKAIDATVAAFAADPGEAPLAAHRHLIDRCFAGGSVEEIIARLDADGSPFAAETAATLRTKSPTSLKLAFRQLTRHGELSFEEVMTLEYRMAIQCNFGHDFFEGVRAQVIDKDRNPRWSPATLDEVGAELVQRHFEPPARGDLVFT
jgi:enoyl-CoA hydratase